MYNVVLIGCGHMGDVHLNDIHNMENVRIYGVVDCDESRAKNMAFKYGAKSYSTSYNEYMKDENTDIIICATYPSSHLEILNECVKYGKHLLCEKPITANMQEAKEFVETVKNSSIKVQIGYILRFNETYKKVAQMIQSGAIGSPVLFRMTQNHHIMDERKYFALLNDASPIVDCGVHYVDVCRWFTGSEITSVDGIAANVGKGAPEGSYNYGLITMGMSDGSIAYYEAGWSDTLSSDNVKEFAGPKGRIKIIERNNRQSNQEEGDLIEYYKFPEKEYKIINVDCVRRPTGAQLSHLIKMIEEDVPSEPTIDDVYKSFSTVMKADKILKEKLNKKGTN